MGRKNKLKRFEDLARFKNVFEYTDFEDSPKPKGIWHKQIFGNRNPIVLELACGKGEYTVNLARQFPDKNFIGIDKKGWRIWIGAKQALDDSLQNVHFIRMFIDHLDQYFSRNEVDQIWITFPDPYLRDYNMSKRLTSPKFLQIYRNILKPGGSIHLKTDSDKLYEYTLEVIDEESCVVLDKVDNIYSERPDDPILTIKTFYEKHHLQNLKTIHYISFCLSE